MKKIIGMIWEVWIFVLMFGQEFYQFLCEQLWGLNPLRLTQRKMFPALAYRDGKKKQMEVRSGVSEIRTIEADGEVGLVEAYLTKWDTVDDYNSTFIRGAFKKTFQERQGKIRLLFNHSTLCGKVVEAREDGTGPLVRCQFNLETTAGKDAYAHVRAGDVDCFSFGFLTVQDQRNSKTSVREIREVKCYEVGPVLFEANGQATITHVRSLFANREDVELLPGDKTMGEMDKRAEDFDQTVAEDELRQKGWRLLMALEDTIYEIWYNNEDRDEIIGKIDEAIASFHAAYVQWVANFIDTFWAGQRSSTITPFKNDLMQAFHTEIGGTRSALEDLAKKSPFTLEDLQLLSRGGILPAEKRDQLKALPEPVATAHHLVRRALVENFCAEIRTVGFSGPEKIRFAALLGIVPEDMLDQRASQTSPAVEDDGGEGDEELKGAFDELRAGFTGLLQQHAPTSPEAGGAAKDDDDPKED